MRVTVIPKALTDFEIHWQMEYNNYFFALFESHFSFKIGYESLVIYTNTDQ